MSIAIPENAFAKAVRQFWAVRDRQIEGQGSRGSADQGRRGEATGGKQLDGFLDTLIELMLEAGVSIESIHAQRALTHLPGYFRPTKMWDLVVVNDGVLKAVLELKAQVGPSFGNNFNNRAEEAIGNATDIWTAYREKAFILSPEPWMGYLFLLEDCEETREPVRVVEPHFPVFREFKEASYALRYQLLCRRLLAERLYSGACLLLSDRDSAHFTKNYFEPAPDLGAHRFIEGLLRHVAPM